MTADAYMQEAIDERAADFKTVREWVFGQIENNLVQFAHDIAEVLSCPQDCDMDGAAKAMVDHWHERMTETIAAQPATQELADAKREEAEEEEREAWDEANNPMWASDPYDEQCRVAAMQQRRREAAALDEYERAHA